MESFIEKIKPVRNKMLAHNDYRTYMDNHILGLFSENDDEKYFQDLAKLCTLVWNKVPDNNTYNRKTIFEFSRSGIVNDPLCPANEARALRDLIIQGLKKKDFSPLAKP